MNHSLRPAITAVLLFALTLGVYGYTLPQTITLEDAGLFQMVCHEGGLAHPPGYPLFTLACRALVVTPDVINGNLVSALFGAATIVVFFLLLWRLTSNTLVAASGALVYAFSATFWAQSIVIEVYSLAALLTYLCWYLLDASERSGDTTSWYLACFVFGLSLSNHWPLALLAAPALFAWSLPLLYSLVSGPSIVRVVVISVIALLLGLTPYLYLLTATNESFGVYGPITTFKGFIEYVSRGQYEDIQAGATIGDRLDYLAWLPLEAMRQLGFLVFLVSVAGIYCSFRILRLNQSVALILNFVGPTFLLATLLASPFDRNGQAIFMPYPIIAYGSVAAWVAIAMVALGSILNTSLNTILNTSLNTWQRQLAMAVAGIAVVSLVFVSNADTNNRRDDAWVEDYFSRTLTALPESAILFVDGDLLSFPAGYLHYVRKQRADITLYNWNSLTFPNRLTPVTASQQEREQVIAEFVVQQTRPVFTIEPRLKPETNYGLFSQFRKPGMPAAIVLPEAEQAADRVLNMYLGNRIFRQQELELAEFIIAGFTRLYIDALAQGDRLNSAQQQRYHTLLGTFSGKMMMIEHELTRENPHKQLLAESAGVAEIQLPRHLLSEQRALFYLYAARIHQLAPADPAQVRLYAKRSIEAHPAADNPAFCMIEPRMPELSISHEPSSRQACQVNLLDHATQ